MADPTAIRPPDSRPRLQSIDGLRGAVMVLMALDHVRDFFFTHRVDPTDIATTTPGLFITRWVTHFCAPVFVFLAGTSACLQVQQSVSKCHSSRSLIIRGLWLILLEFTVIRWSWTFQPGSGVLIGQVFWALGMSMLALAGLIHLPVRWAVVLGGILIATHNAFDSFEVAPESPGFALWSVLHQGQFISLGDSFAFLPLYPLIPWIGVMAIGYGFGAWMQEPIQVRSRRLGLAALVALGCFAALRVTNLYGDASPWASDFNGVRSVLSFFNCTKYPPSLLYLLMTLGPMAGLLSLWERQGWRVPRVLVTLGRVPLFFYLLHVPLIHAAAAMFAAVQGKPAVAAFLWHNGPFRSLPDGFGTTLANTYLVWLTIVLALYPACAAFSHLKQRHRGASWTRFI